MGQPRRRIPSLPSQIYEAIGVGLLVVVVLGVLAIGRLAGRSRSVDGRLFVVVLGCRAIVRFVVAGTWRDPAVVGPLVAEQVLDIGIMALSLALFAGPRPARAASDCRRHGRRDRRRPRADPRPGVGPIGANDPGGPVVPYASCLDRTAAAGIRSQLAGSGHAPSILRRTRYPRCPTTCHS